MSLTLLILKINLTVEDIQMMIKYYFDSSTCFRFSKISVKCSVYICSCPCPNKGGEAQYTHPLLLASPRIFRPCHGPILQKKISQTAAKNIKARDQCRPPKIYSYTHKEVYNRVVAYHSANSFSLEVLRTNS